MAGSALATAVVLLTAAALVSCGDSSTQSTHSASPSRTSSPSLPPAPSPVNDPVRDPVNGPVRDTVETRVPQATVSDGRPRRARLSIPAIGLHDLVVVPYPGRTDDARGTRIQDGGVGASPYGPHGGVGPGGLGNYQVTAHRTSSTQAFRSCPPFGSASGRR